MFATLYDDGLASPTGPGLGRPAPIHAAQLVCTYVPNEPESDVIGVCHLFSSQAKRPLLQLTSGPVCAAYTVRSPAPRKRPPLAYPKSQAWVGVTFGQTKTRLRRGPGTQTARAAAGERSRALRPGWQTRPQCRMGSSSWQLFFSYLRKKS
jgi:hypothetical protein